MGISSSTQISSKTSRFFGRSQIEPNISSLNVESRPIGHFQVGLSYCNC
jgi:hypothetical protein